jgi:hypothetical protein
MTVKKKVMKKAASRKPVKRASKKTIMAEEFVLGMSFGDARRTFLQKATKRDITPAKRLYQRFVDIIEEFRDQPGLSGHNVTMAAVEFARIMVVSQLEHAAQGSPGNRNSVASSASRG